MTGKECFFIYALSSIFIWLGGGFEPHGGFESVAVIIVDIFGGQPFEEKVLETKAGLMFFWGACGLTALIGLIFAPNKTFME